MDPAAWPTLLVFLGEPQVKAARIAELVFLPSSGFAFQLKREPVKESAGSAEHAG